MTIFYSTKEEAEARRTKKEEQIYYKAGQGWYIVNPEFVADSSGNIRFYST